MEVNLEGNIYPTSRLEEVVIESFLYHRAPIKFFDCIKSCRISVEEAAGNCPQYGRKYLKVVCR